jgi:hypothetical protein
MFEQLFGSKTRVKLLSLFLNNPGRAYYVREITRKIDEQINSVRRELSNLLSIGIIKSESSNNKLYYEVDETYEHYGELHHIFAKIPVKSKAIKETKEEDTIAKRLRATGQVKLAFLTGYFVHDDNAGVDICIIGDVNRASVAKVVAELEKEQNRELNYTIMTTDDYSYRLNLNDRFLMSLLDTKRIVLIDGDQKEQEIDHTVLALTEDEVPVNVHIDA